MEVLITLLALAAGAGVYLLIVEWTGLSLNRMGRNRGAETLLMWTVIAELFIGGFAWLLAKDRLLRRRIRRVLNTRGTCGPCGYALTGLPVGADRTVMCPECGNRIEADESLGEIAADATGASRFLPSPEVIPAIDRWFTARRVRLIKRLAVGIPAGVVVLSLLAWGGYEWFLRSQAAEARTARTGVRPLIEFMEANQPEGTDALTPDAWDSFGEAIHTIARTDIAVTREGPVEYPTDMRPENSFDWLFAEAEKDASEEDVAWIARMRGLARELLDAYREAGVYSMLDEMATRRRAVHMIGDAPPGQPPFEFSPPELSSARHLFRINRARMRLAYEAGDSSEFLSALEADLALARILRQSGLIVDRLTSMAIGAGALSDARDVLAARPESQWVDGIQGAIDRQRGGLSYADTLKVEEAAALDGIAWYFSDPDRARGGKYSSLIAKPRVPNFRVPDESLGTYRQNVEAAISAFAATTERVNAEPFERQARAPHDPQFYLITSYFGWLRFIPSISDQERLWDRGMSVLLALERYRCAHGEYPATLDELVPTALESLPLDPFSGAPFRYQRVPATEEGDDSFLLYSVGADGKDDGGVASSNAMDALQPRASGLDFVIGPAGS